MGERDASMLEKCLIASMLLKCLAVCICRLATNRKIIKCLSIGHGQNQKGRAPEHVIRFHVSAVLLHSFISE